MSHTAMFVVFLATLAEIVLASWLLFRGRGSRIDFARVLQAASALGVFVAVLIVGGVSVVHSYFLGVCLAYTATMVLLPSMGLALLLASRSREVTKPVRALAALSLILIPIGIDATFVEPFRLVTESRDVPIARERDAVARIMAAKPDLILLPGDLQQVGFDHYDELIPSFRELLAPLSAPLGVYYVEGNCESTAEARQLLDGTPVKILDNEIVRFDRDGMRVALCGVDLMFASPHAHAALDAIQRADDDKEVRIVVAHRPDVIDALAPNTRVDLVVAGHTHGGQVNLPFFGPPITLSGVPRHIAAGGLHTLDGRRVYVSRGIGWEHGHAPRVRFLCAPEVTLLTLRPRGPNAE
jgi:predicted MPP superfamily phosphohydrolase